MFRCVRESDVPKMARRLMAKAMPGPVTLLLPVDEKTAGPMLDNPEVFSRLVASANPKSAHTGLADSKIQNSKYPGVIGIRCPDQPLTQEMLSLAGGPVVAPRLTSPVSPRRAPPTR